MTYVSTNYNIFSTAKPILFFSSIGESVSGTYRVDNGIEPRKIIEIVNVNTVSSIGGQLGISDLGSDKYNLRAPILITLRQEANDEYIVSFGEAELSRSGGTAKEALDWLKSSIVELYELFKKQHSRLGPLPQKQLRTLEKYLVAKSHSKTSSH